ncbi:7-deoxyloganetin glucosyltransferase-like [Solanum dulcamara]|uniref:7-deoxyloganetin glucosyltransferase-like n=1 Tax=Solanum dulcamara TaxID=45834 RepID=UPI0024861EAE|nr:7-deoxyloganetin glucosyltransferase-like [Solanum dulcamara]XP_055833838.1 7-deoxyloganetin glucosyltransferase-like [Solanum dulcamara]XP_055833839.1 7-deoxyloganetin glucosyltransferase-like [Solanum dulcamara]
MSSTGPELDKPHAVCIPYPAQGHVSAMLKLAKILSHKGFHITFVYTEYNHRRLLKSRGPDSLKGLPYFRFETIPDGLPPCDADSTQDIPPLCESTTTTCLGPFKELLTKLNDTCSSNVPPVSCIFSDGCMSFILDAAQDLGIPPVFFWTYAACGTLGYMHYCNLVDKGYIPLKDESCLTNGYLETTLDWIPGMKDVRLRDLPSFLRTANPDDYMIKFTLQEAERSKQYASAIVVNTFEALEKEVLESLQTLVPPVYVIGPLHLLLKHVDDENLMDLGSNLWKEEPKCLEWLDSKKPNSVVYVNFGSITVMTLNHLIEFAWGLANSQLDFLWIIRPDIVLGEQAVLPPEFMEETKERGRLVSWCQQEQVLNHPAIGGFLTHSGWNSTLESISSGVPMICWPFFAEQPTNCWFCCTKLGIGMEINNNVKRDEVEALVRELMTGEKGKEMKKRALEWKKLAEEAVKKPAGSSYVNIDKLINEILLSPKH